MAQQTLNELYEIIKNRKAQPKEGSYTNYLFDKGLDKIVKKVGEESTEVVIAAKNEDPQEDVYKRQELIRRNDRKDVYDGTAAITYGVPR